MRVQSLERTFIDKIFAICDYYLDGRITEHSRHIYDLYKLWQEVNIKEELKELFKQVREDRKSHSACLSAQDNVDLVEILKEIKERNIYKSDYELITKFLIFENVEYETAIGVISQIIKSGLFSITKQ